MPASIDNMVMFPGADSGTLSWHERSLDNATRMAEFHLERASQASQSFTDLHSEWTRLAAEATATIAALDSLHHNLLVLRDCGKALVG